MNTQAPILRPIRLHMKNEVMMENTAFIGPKSEWWPKQIDEGGTPEYRRELYRQTLMAPRKWKDRQKIRRLLRGKDIASACPLDQASFVDVLLEIANGTE
jgi:hypothetical protein